MNLISVKKYELTEEEIKSIEKTRDIISELHTAGYDDCDDFYGMDLGLWDVQMYLDFLIDNNHKNLEC